MSGTEPAGRLPEPDARTRRSMAEWAADPEQASPAVRETTATFLAQYFAAAAAQGRRQALRSAGLVILVGVLVLVVVTVAVLR